MGAESSAAYASTVAQIVPVLLLAGLAVPSRLTQDRRRRRALADIVLTGALVGAAALAEFAALFGVNQGGLSAGDRRLLTTLLVTTAALTTVRVAAPLVREYADETQVPERRVWLVAVTAFVVSFISLLFGLVELLD